MMDNLVVWSFFHTFAAEEVSLIERNTFLHCFSPDISCLDGGIAERWAPKTEKR